MIAINIDGRVVIQVRLPGNGDHDERGKVLNIVQRHVKDTVGDATVLDGIIVNDATQETIKVRLVLNPETRNFYQGKVWPDDWVHTPRSVSAEDSGYWFMGLAL